MKMKLLKSFMKDQLSFCCTYFLGVFLVALFYYISVGKKIEIIYPLSISLFVYIIFLLYHFYEYIRIYEGLEEMVSYQDYQGSFHTELNKKVSESMKAVHTDYLNRLGVSENNKKKER